MTEEGIRRECYLLQISHDPTIFALTPAEKRYILMGHHRRQVRAGNYRTAWLLLALLNNGFVKPFAADDLNDDEAEECRNAARIMDGLNLHRSRGHYYLTA